MALKTGHRIAPDRYLTTTTLAERQKQGGLQPKSAGEQALTDTRATEYSFGAP
jgi:hypothetical protein